MVKVLKSDLDDVYAKRISVADRVAWDIETSGLEPYKDQIGTVQLHAQPVGSVVVQVDATVPYRLIALLNDHAVQKVFHHAMFDLRFMAAHWKAEPSNIACTKVAAKLLLRDAVEDERSLQALLARYLGVEISKDERSTDWLAPNLTPEQIEYAVNDVAYLLPLQFELEEKLRQAGLYSLYRSCLSFLPARVTLDLGRWPDVFTY